MSSSHSRHANPFALERGGAVAPKYWDVHFLRASLVCSYAFTMPVYEAAEAVELSVRPLDTVQTACCICGHADAVPIAVGEDFEYRVTDDTFLVVRCRQCGLVYLNPRPALTEFDRIYPPNYHAYEFSPQQFGFVHAVRRRLEARRVLRYCQGLGPGARILDAGCGDGFHLALLRDFGRSDWKLEGIDASDRAVRKARESGLNVRLGLVESCDLKPGSYDLILLIATLEHTSDPAVILRGARRLLAPGGRVVVVTDNVRTLDFRLFGRRHWGGYHFPRHWNLFDRRTLEQLAIHAGLEVDSLGTVMSPVNWVYSIRNWLCDRNSPNWLIEQFSLKAPVSLAVFTVVDAMFNAAGQGALLRMVARRVA